jgi:hypothetical protein
MTGGPDDERDLEEFLARRSPVNDAYRESAESAGETPPAQVDDWVRRHAHEAVQGPRRPQRPPLWWLRPVALAATVVLSVSVILQLQRLPGSAPAELAPDSSTVEVGLLPPAETVADAPLPSAPVAPGDLERALAPPASMPPAVVVDTAPELRAARADAAAAAGPAAPSSEPYDQALAAIRQRLGTAAIALQPRTSAPAARELAADAAAAAPDTDAELRRILALDAAGERAAAAAALAEYLQAHADDPLAAIYTQETR